MSPINPLRSEDEAFRFLLLVIGYFALIALAAYAGGTWAGLAGFVGLTAAAVAWWLRSRRTRPS